MGNRIDHIVVQLVKEKSKIYPTKTIKSPDEAAHIAREYIGSADREVLIAMTLNTKNEVINVGTLSIGSLNASILHPREVFKPAILSNAASVILAHNHPSGHVAPSPEDIAVTERVHEAGEIIGIELLDHLIIDTESDRYLSLKERGYL